jgi:hypothetical protein
VERPISDKLKLHNTVKIKPGLKNNKPFQDLTSKKFSSHFQKQGVDANNFDSEGDEEEKFERSDMKDKGRPKEQYKEDDEDKTDQGS